MPRPCLISKTHKMLVLNIIGNKQMPDGFLCPCCFSFQCFVCGLANGKPEIKVICTDHNFYVGVSGPYFYKDKFKDGNIPFIGMAVDRPQDRGNYLPGIPS